MTTKPLSKVAAILMSLSIGSVLALRADENKAAPGAEQVKADAEKAEKAAKEAAAKAEAEKAKAEAKAKEAAEKAKAKEEAAKAKEAKAKEKAEKAAAAKAEGKQDAGAAGMTQGAAAIALSDKLALFPALPAGISANEAAAALTAQGISPFEGWKTDETLTIGDFAKVLVEAMGRSDEIAADKKDKAEAYVELLKGMGINVESGQEGLDEVSVLPEIFSAAIDGASNTSDPLRNRIIYGYPDERVAGTDALVRVLPQPGVKVTPPVVTPPTPTTPRPSRPRPTPPKPEPEVPVDPSPTVNRNV